MSKITAFIDRAGGSSSTVPFQFTKYLCSKKDSIIISRSPIEDTEVKAGKEVITPPGNRLMRVILFPIYSIVYFVLHARDSKLLVTNQRGESILPALILSKLTGKKWVILAFDSPDGKHNLRSNYRSMDLAEIYLELMFLIAKRGYMNADKIITTDESEIFDQYKDKVKLFPAGVDCDKFEEVATSGETQENKVVYVGNMYYHRGIDIILESFELAESDFKLELIGPAPPQEYDIPENTESEEDFRSLVNKHEKVEYCGPLPHEEVIPKLVESDIGLCLLPYDRGIPHAFNSYPIKVFEYMYAEMGIVATKTEVIQKILSENQLVDSNNPNAFAKRIDELLLNKEILNELKVSNKKKGEKYCWEGVINKVDNEIENMV